VALLHFTSGTTGRPRGALHVPDAVVAHDVTAWFAPELHPDDRFWCTADPEWVTGTSYGIIAPLVHGLTSVVDEADFDGERWYRILADERITTLIWIRSTT
jgi:acetyl-CoA synthetase